MSERRINFYLLRSRITLWLASLIVFMLMTCSPPPAQRGETAIHTPVNLFDGVSVRGWRKIPFNKTGKIEVQDSSIVLHRGGYLTGIRWTGAVKNIRLKKL